MKRIHCAKPPPGSPTKRAILPSEVFSFINPDGNTQQGVRLKHPDSNPLPFRTGDQADIDGHTDHTNVFHMESFFLVST